MEPARIRTIASGARSCTRATFARNSLDYLFPILLCHPFGFRHNHQLLSAVLLNRKGRRRTGPQSVIGLLDRHLDVLRILVDATDNDHVFDATIDK